MPLLLLAGSSSLFARPGRGNALPLLVAFPCKLLL